MHRENHARLQLGLVVLADLRKLDHRHPDRMPGDVAEVETALEEALRDRSMRVARGPPRAERRGGGRVVLLVGIQHPLRVLARLTRAYGAGDLDPVTAG